MHGTFRGCGKGISGAIDIYNLNYSNMLKKVLKLKDERRTNFKRCLIGTKMLKSREIPFNTGL